MSAKMETLPRLQFGQLISRHWVHRLSPSEFKVVNFIYDQTIGFGRETEVLSVRQIMHGRGKNNYGTGLSRATVFRCLRSLKRQLLLVCSGNGKEANRLGLDWKRLVENTIPGEGDVALATRKKGIQAAGKGLAQRKERGSQDETPPRRNLRPHKKEKVEGKSVDCASRSRTSSPPEGLGSEYNEQAAERGLTLPAPEKHAGSEVVPEGTAKTSALKTNPMGAIAAAADRVLKGATAREAKPRKISVGELERVWEGAFRAAWDGVPMTAWSPKARWLAKAAIKRKVFRDINHVEFIEWAVTEWGALRQTAFGWMDKSPPPAHPIAEFAMVFLDRVIAAYVQRAAIRTFIEKAGPEGLRRYYRERGFSPDLAEQRAEEVRSAPSRAREDRNAVAALLSTLKREREESRIREAAMARRLINAENPTPVENIDPGKLVFKPYDEA